MTRSHNRREKYVNESEPRLHGRSERRFLRLNPSVSVNEELYSGWRMGPEVTGSSRLTCS